MSNSMQMTASGFPNYAKAAACIKELAKHGIESGETAGGLWVAYADLPDEQQMKAHDIVAEFGGSLLPGDTPLGRILSLSPAEKQAWKKESGLL